MSDLIARVHAWWSAVIAPPELIDPALSQRAQMLHAILLTVIATHSMLLLIGAPFIFTRKLEGGALMALVLLAACFSWRLMRRGAVVAASHVIAWTLWGIYSVLMLLTDPGNVGLYIPIIFISAALLGPIWAMAVGVSGVLVAGITIFGAQLGITFPRFFPAPPGTRLLFFITQSILAVVPFYLIGRGLTRALERLGGELRERTLTQHELQRSEGRLALALDAARTGIWEWDIATGVMIATPQAEAVFELQPGEFAGTYEDFLRLVHPADVDRVADFNRGVLEGSMRGRAIEHRILSRADEVRWVEGRGTLQRDAAGRPERVIGTVVDVTPRKLAEQALRESEDLHRTMISTMAEGVMLRDMEGELLLCNSAAERIIGVSAREMERWSFPLAGWRTIHEDGAPFPVDEHPVMITLRTGEPCFGIVMGVDRGSGPLTWISVNSVAMQRDGEERPYAVLTTLFDITAGKHAQQMLDLERRLLRTLVDDLPDDIFIIDATGRYTMVNAAWLAQVGIASEEAALGKTVFDFFESELAARFDAENRRVMESGAGLYNQRRPLQRPGREKRWILTSKIPMWSAEGRIGGIIGINRDVTELNNALDTLQQERNLLRSIIDTVPDAILVKDRECRYVIMNRQGLALRGMNGQEGMVGKSAADFLSGPDAQAQEEEDRQVMDSGIAVLNVRRRPALLRDGREWVLSSKVPLRDAAGVVNGMVEVNRDITDLQTTIEQVNRLNTELEDRVRVRTEELQKANQELESFSYSVSHDLRAPLRSIMGFGNFLLKENYGQLDAEGKARLGRILAASARMGELIDDLLKLARISRQAMLPRRVDLNSLATDIIAGFAEADRERRVDVEIAPDLTVNADAGLMRVALDNLLGNAWKFTARRADARIEFGATSVDGERAYFVRDNGAGFEMKYAAKLFTPFQRMHSQQQFEGTGIGLATVKGIIERHRGRIWIESAVEGGTTVFFTVGDRVAGA